MAERPYRSNTPLGMPTVISVVGGCFFLAVCLPWALLWKEPVPPPKPSPNQEPVAVAPARFKEAPAPQQEPTEEEQFDADARAFRNLGLSRETRLGALRRLVSRSTRRDEVLAQIVDEYRLATLYQQEDLQDDLLRILLDGFNRDGVAAFFRNFPDKRYDPRLPTGDKPFWTGLHILIRNCKDDLELLEVLFARPDRVALFRAYLTHRPAPARAALAWAARDRDPAIRLLAVEAPGIGTDALRERFANDDDATVRAQALYRLATYVTTDRWQPDAERALRDPAPAVRLAAGWAVGVRAKDEATAAPVLLELTQPLLQPKVPAHAGSALGAGLSSVSALVHAHHKRLGLRALQTLLTFAPEHRAGAREVLLALARQPNAFSNEGHLFATFPGECPGLLAVVMRDRDRADERWRQLLARRLADHFPKEGVKEAEPRLAHADPRVRWHALDLLIRSDPERAGRVVPELVPLFRTLGEPSAPVVKRASREGLFVEPGPDPLPAVDWALAKDVRPTEVSLDWLATAFRAGETGVLPLLTKLGPKLEPALSALVGCGVGEQAVEPYRTMLRSAGSKAAPAVIAAMSNPKGNPHEYVLLPVLVALAAEVPDGKTALSAWVAVRRNDSALMAFVSNSADGVKPVFAPVWVAAVRGTRERQAGAREALAKHGPDAAPLVPALVELLRTLTTEKEPPAEADEAVIEALGRIGPKAKAAVPALIELFPRRGHSAALACSRIGSAAVLELVKALRHADPGVRGYAAEALGKVGPAAKELALAELLRLEKADPEDWVRRSARQALQVLEPGER